MNSNYERSTESANVNDVSRISAGSVIKGEITSPNDIRIDGTFEGKIISQARVVVGEKAVIKGDIICNNADYWGRIEGNSFVKDTLSLKDTCVVEGDLHIRRLQVELDAKFNGVCKMISEEEFTQLTEGNRPGMYDVPGQDEAQTPAEEYPVGNGESPFSINSDSGFPEA
jgi:cytoskeletal protein CcmA (bactofilin family)